MKSQNSMVIGARPKSRFVARLTLEDMSEFYYPGQTDIAEHLHGMNLHKEQVGDEVYYFLTAGQVRQLEKECASFEEMAKEDEQPTISREKKETKEIVTPEEVTSIPIKGETTKARLARCPLLVAPDSSPAHFSLDNQITLYYLSSFAVEGMIVAVMKKGYGLDTVKNEEPFYRMINSNSVASKRAYILFTDAPNTVIGIFTDVFFSKTYDRVKSKLRANYVNCNSNQAPEGLVKSMEDAQKALLRMPLEYSLVAGYRTGEMPWALAIVKHYSGMIKALKGDIPGTKK